MTRPTLRPVQAANHNVVRVDENPSWFDAAVLSHREAAWGATMAGHQDGDAPIPVVAAHRDSAASVDLARPLLRDEREEMLRLGLAKGATLAQGGGDRTCDEAPDPVRTCFERDRDRILHSSSFRRLAGKTQVFVFPGDHQRTRLTHALEVAQVARSIAQACRLNVALAEAIALGHDCGHGPGGHASEEALSPYVNGGYDHAVWGADVALTPLNLCAETLDGIRNHSWSRPAPSTPEGEVVSWADRIAYVCHDVEDAAAAGVVSIDDLPAIVRERCGITRSDQLNAFIAAMVDATASTGRIAMTADTAEALAAFRRWNYERIYLRPESRQQAGQVVELLRALVDMYAARPDALPEAFRVDAAGTPALTHSAVTYVSGMTDRFACVQALTHLAWDPARLPAGVDVLALRPA